MDTKALGAVKVKDAAKGEVEAVFATFNEIDLDGDVTTPGAFPEGAEVPISAYNHGSHGAALPVGLGKIRQTDTEAILDGQFFLDTTAGADTFTVVKRLADIGKGEWSYGYEPVEAEPGVFDGQDVRFLKQLDVLEVSPVLQGAGIGTRTLSAKGRKAPTKEASMFNAAIRPHGSHMTNRAWDAKGVVAAIADDATVSDLRSVFALARAGADPEAKTSYDFPHHHGVGGPANFRACVALIARLNGASGGTKLSAADREGVYAHLAEHLRSSDREPPELRPPDGETKLHLHEKAIEVMDVISGYMEHFQSVEAERTKQGRGMSAINLEALDWAEEDLGRLWSAMKDLNRRLHDTPREIAAVERARYLLRKGASRP